MLLSVGKQTTERFGFAQAVDHMSRDGKVRRVVWRNKRFFLTRESEFHLTEADVFARDWELHKREND